MIEFTLMLVDDEKIVVDGLLNSFDWRMLGFKVVGTAQDGEEALEKFHELKPQVILMDIKMPVMDGLLCLEKIKRVHSDTEVILLSGYDEFSYAKKGIQLGAFDYVLKIDLFSELIGVLTKLHETLQIKLKRTNQYRNLMDLKNNYLFLEFISGRNPLELTNHAENQLYCVVSLWFHDVNKKHRDLFMDMSFNLPYSLGRDNQYIHFIFFSEEFTEEALTEMLHEWAVKIQEYLSLKGISSYLIGIGGIQTDVTHIPRSYREAMKALDYQRYKENEGSAFFYNQWQGSMSTTEYNTSSLRNWMHWVYSGDDFHLVRWLKTIFAEAYTNKNLHASDIQALCMQILLQFDNTLKEENASEVNSGQYLDKLLQYDSLQDLEIYVMEIIQRRCKYLHEKIQSGKNKSIAAVKEYIDQMYMTNLRMEDLAQKYYFSAGYLSTKFKELTGESFSKYIINKRMKTACELLISTELKVYEIANKIGYSDEKHFSKQFTHYHKESPREYRNHRNEK